MLTLLIGIILGLVLLWVLFFAGRVDSSTLAGKENENEEAGSEPHDYEPRHSASLQVWDWDEDDDEADDEEEDDD